MIPLGDDNSSRKSTPVITYALILINILFFFLEMAGGEAFIKKWSVIPSEFLQNPMANLPTLFTAMFMHAGLGHIIGNMIYLWIFGDNVEDSFGKIPYLLFYLACGLAATFAQIFFNPTSSVPNLGASGAIAGILGAYLLLFPKAKVNILVGQHVTQMSALIVIGFWFAVQFFSGIASASSNADVGGVAYMAHIGGFLMGLLITFVYKGTQKV